MTVIHLEGVSKKFPQSARPALQDVSFGVEHGEIFTLLGESGSGKTTLLRLIAGFEAPTAGRVIVNSQAVADRHRMVPPEKRAVRMVFQEHTLFPHLTVGDNIGFGLSGIGSRRKRQRISQELELVGLSGYQRRYPHELSGGQKRRVELARALATDPVLLLLDEPFSGLDANLKHRVRQQLQQILRASGITSIMVTHDLHDALGLSDRLAILQEGKLEQVGTPSEVFSRPGNRYVAELMGGANLIAGRITGQGLETALGTWPNTDRLPRGKVLVCIRPEGLTIDPTAAAQNCRGRVTKSVFQGWRQQVRVVLTDETGKPFEVAVEVEADVAIRVGQPVKLSIDPRAIQVIADAGA